MLSNAILCKANLYSDFTVPPSARRSCCRDLHVLWIFFVRRMQVILFYNVHVCNIGEEKFGGWWWSFSWLGQSNPIVWHLHCVCDCPNKATGLLFQFWVIQRVTKTAYWYCLSLYCCYKRMRNSVAYCCRDLVVNWCKALLANRLRLCYESWTSRQLYDVLLFQSADIRWVLIGCMDQDGPVHDVGDLARFSHFKTTFWRNLYCEKFDCRCKWLACVNSFWCMTPNRCIFCPLKQGCQLLCLIISFNIMFLWLQYARWKFIACQFVFSNFIKSLEQCLQFERFQLGTMFAVWKIPPAICSMVNRTSNFRTKLTGNNAEASRVTTLPFDI